MQFFVSLVAMSPRTPSQLRTADVFPVVASLPKEHMHLILNILRWRDVLTSKMCREGRGINLLTCFYIDLYRDALCEIGNKMHNAYRYSQLSHSYVEAISGLGLESLCVINVQFSEIPVTCVCFYWVMTRLFARCLHFPVLSTRIL